jgi:hypothetical protein
MQARHPGLVGKQKRSPIMPNHASSVEKAEACGIVYSSPIVRSDGPPLRLSCS